ncbi:hypothetical protein ACDH54_27665, partial [Pseudomonas syringae]|uniref:hypothetical protein n=2 Tax=Pseudomonas syringae group TaxID=136849 RepID=UPI0035321685
FLKKNLMPFRKRPTYTPGLFCYMPINIAIIFSCIEVFTIERQSHPEGASRETVKIVGVRHIGLKIVHRRLSPTDLP